MDKVTTELLLRIDNLLSRFSRIKAGWNSSTYASGFNDTVGYEALVTEVISLITHIYGNGHPHTQRVLHAL